jgi:hypothetical protein
MILNSFCTTIAVLLLAINANAQTPNFTGDWKIDLNKSNLGGAPASFAGSELIINQDQNTIEIQRESILKDSTIKYTEKLSFDGKPLSSDLNTRLRVSNAKWSNDKQALIETALVWNKSDEEKSKYKSVETFSFSPDKTTLYYIRQVESKEVNFTIKAVYNKVD